MTKHSNLKELTGNLTSNQAQRFVRSLPPESESRQAIEALKQIRHIGDATALEVFVSLCCLLVSDDEKTRTV